MSKLTIILISFLLMACQVEKKSGKDDYISDHRNAKNSFTIKTSHSGTFKTDDVLTFTLSFPSNVLVAGAPQLALEIGNTTQYAEYVSGDNTKNLTFTYTVQATDSDNDGIRFQSINLNGGSLQFYLKEVLTDCSTSINPVHYTNIRIDNAAPVIEAITHAHPLQTYYKGDTLNFSVKFSEEVFITGDLPELDLGFTAGGIKKASYFNGSGTDTLTFRYIVDDTVATSTGIAFPSSLSLNGGSIKDSIGFDLINTIDDPILTTARDITTILRIEGRIPKLLTVDLPPNATYGASQELDFTLVFDRDVNIAGNPRLELVIGATTRHANYINGAGTNALTFQYVPIPGDEDSDGITLTNTVIFPTATDYIHSSVGTASYYRFANIASNNNLKEPVTSEIFVAAIQPRIINITRANDLTSSPRTNAPDNVWIIGQDLYLQVQFNTPIFVNNDNGSPTLEFTINGIPKTATYLSGGDGQTTLIFRYTVAEGDHSNQADIGVGTFHLNNSVIEDARETQAQVTITQTTVPQTVIDGERPYIISLSAPANGTYSQVATPVNLRSLEFPVLFNEPVVLGATASSNLGITIGVQLRNARATSRFSNERTLTFRYIIAADNDLDGIQITSPISGTANVRDDAGNEAIDLGYASPDLTQVLVDTRAPIISPTMTEPNSGTYNAGQTLSFTVNFDEPITYTASGGHPRLSLNIGGETRYATVVTPVLPLTNSLTFEYTVQTGLQTSAITLNALEENTMSAIHDLGLNPITGSLPALSNIIAVDSVAPVMTPSLISPTGYYEEGEVIQIKLTANEDVTVTGSPILTSNLGGTDVDFEYQPTGSDNRELIFEYTVTASDFDFDGLGNISTLINPTDIEDASENNPTAALASTLTMTGIKIKPTSFIGWSAGQATDVYSGDPHFSGASETTCGADNCLSVSDSQLTTSISGGNTVYAQMSIGISSVTQDLFNNFVIENDGGIVLNGLDVGDILVDGTPINYDGGKYNLGISFGTFFSIEINLPSPINDITGTNFTGDFKHLFLFSAPLTPTERGAIQTAAN